MQAPQVSTTGQASSNIHIVGVGDDGVAGLSRQVLDILERAELMVGTPSLLAKFAHFGVAQHGVGSDLEQLVETLESHRGRRVVLLTHGDPLFYGTSRYLCDRLGKDRFEVMPHVSSMQLAFARVKESWDDAYLVNLATQASERAVDRIRLAEKVGIFTTETETPNQVAKMLLARGIEYFHAYVCENLGSPDERVTQGSLGEIAEIPFRALNVMILIRKPGVPDRVKELVGRRLFGNPDELFLQSKPKRGLLTPSEVRSIALAEMEIQEGTVVWDVGAGSGSVAIEAAQLAWRGLVYAIEMDAEEYGLVTENAKRFGVGNLTAILGEAPQAFVALPDPEAVFLDGTGRHLVELVRDVWNRMAAGGRLIANVASLENVVRVEAFLHDDCAVESQMWMIQVSRSNIQLGRSRLEAANPTFLIKATKPHV